MIKVNPENYVAVQGWMRTELDLKGNDLLVYAIIYGYSQDGESEFTGSLQYLADWCGATKSGIQKNLKNLLDKDLIKKREIEKNGVKFCAYSCILCNSVVQGIQHSCTNNIANKQIDKKDIITINSNNIKTNSQNFTFGTKQKKPKKETLYSKCLAVINEFTDDVILQNMLEKCLQMFLGNSKESGIPFYTNTFKGKLNKLKTLSTDNYVQRDIVKQTIDNGWNSFYEIKTNRRKNDIEYVSAELGIVDSVTYTEEERRQQEAWREQMIKDGKQVKF